jgi:hypothetical protein
MIAEDNVMFTSNDQAHFSFNEDHVQEDRRSCEQQVGEDGDIDLMLSAAGQDG